MTVSHGFKLLVPPQTTRVYRWVASSDGNVWYFYLRDPKRDVYITRLSVADRLIAYGEVPCEWYGAHALREYSMGARIDATIKAGELIELGFRSEYSVPVLMRGVLLSTASLSEAVMI